jgi:hypothetical protein
MKKILERNVEHPITDYAKERGCLSRKMNGLGYAGWPDRMFIGPKGEIGFLELKRPGQVPTALQAAMIIELRGRGVKADWTDNVVGGRQFIDDLVGPPAHEGY